MTFPDIPAGSRVFVDSNTFVYHFGPHPVLQSPCQQLLERVSAGAIASVTSTAVLSDVAHRLMTLEAAGQYGWPMTGIAYRLKRHPAELQALANFRRSVEEVPNFGVQVLSVELPHVLSAAALSQQLGLLSGDALVVAMMQAHGLALLASHDADFDRVPGITRYAPA
jgi:predicted nucleic acid-binding protein